MSTGMQLRSQGDMENPSEAQPQYMLRAACTGLQVPIPGSLPHPIDSIISFKRNLKRFPTKGTKQITAPSGTGHYHDLARAATSDDDLDPPIARL